MTDCTSENSNKNRPPTTSSRWDQLQPTTIHCVLPRATDHDLYCVPPAATDHKPYCLDRITTTLFRGRRRANNHLISRPSTDQQTLCFETINLPTTLFRRHQQTSFPQQPTDPHDFLSVQPQRTNHDFSLANSHQPTQITHSFKMTWSVANDNQPTDNEKFPRAALNKQLLYCQHQPNQKDLLSKGLSSQTTTNQQTTNHSHEQHSAIQKHMVWQPTIFWCFVNSKKAASKMEGQGRCEC